MSHYYILDRSVASTGYRYIELVNNPSQLTAQKCPSCGEELCLPCDGHDAVYRIMGRGDLGDMLTDGISVLLSYRVREMLKKESLARLHLNRTPSPDRCRRKLRAECANRDICEDDCLMIDNGRELLGDSPR
jgi:hypothetical protein